MLNDKSLRDFSKQNLHGFSFFFFALSHREKKKIKEAFIAIELLSTVLLFKVY
jgi:hypothetical protein